MGDLTAALANVGADLDPFVGHAASLNATENNCIPFIIGAGLLAYEAYEIYHTYKTEGPEAALEQLGISVATSVALGGVGKVAFEVATPMVKEVVFKVGKTTFPSLKAAYEAAMAGKPVLRGALVKLEAKLDKIALTSIGSKVDGTIHKVRLKHGKTQWVKNPVGRGVIMEPKLIKKVNVGKTPGPKLAKNFRTIDDFAENVALSAKTLDLHAPSYQNLSTLRNKITHYIDKIAKYAGNQKGLPIELEDIKGRALGLGIPPGVNKGQRILLEEMKRYAESQDVQLIIKIIR